MSNITNNGTVTFDADGVCVTVFDHGDCESMWYAALHGQVLARVSSYEPGKVCTVRTHPRLDCPDTVMAVLLEQIASYPARRAAAA